MLSAGLKVLDDRENIELQTRKVVHHSQQLVPRLAVADLDPRLREQSLLLRPVQHHDRTLVVRRAPHETLKAGHALDVVGEDVRPRSPDRLERLALPEEVGRQDLDPGAGGDLTDLADRLGEDRRTAVLQLVPVDARDDGVLDPELPDGERGPPGFVKIELRGPPGFDGAEAARARADVAQDHERRGLPAPALRDVGTPRVLADRMQPLFARDLERGRVPFPARQPHPEPGRLPQDYRIGMVHVCRISFTRAMKRSASTPLIARWSNERSR